MSSERTPRDKQGVDGDFAIFGSYDGDGTSVADIPKRELLRGFGDHSHTPRKRRTGMKKTSVYLSESELERLASLAELEGKSQSEVIRLAIAEYQPCRPPKRFFHLDGCVEGDGTDVADIPEEEYLKGFGADSFGK